MFGVLVFALNESKFIGYALRGYLSSSLVKKIAVVEGCVQLNKHAANEDGLSKDDMAEVVEKIMAEDDTDRIVYERMGWAENKSALQTRCIELIEDTPGIEYYILAGADEVYDPADLNRLDKEIKRLGKPDIPLYEFIHFWKRPDLRATGSMWDTWMHRCYRNYGKGMRFGNHAGPPLKPDGSQLGPSVKTKGVKVYHYSAMKDKQDIKDRLRLYQARDRLGTDTWTNWRPGQPTQWTHGGGTAEPYHGKHPPAIARDVWALTPDLPRPKTKVFIPSGKEERDRVKDFVVGLSKLCPVTAIGLVNPRWRGVQFRKVSNLKKMLADVELLVVANRNLSLMPVGQYNVIFAYYPAPDHRPFHSGYKIVCLDEKAGKTWSGKAVKIGHPAQMLALLSDLPVVVGDGMGLSVGQAAGSVGKPTVPGKRGQAGQVRIVSTRPLVAAWDFVNPLDTALTSKRARVGYELRLASGRVINSKRAITLTPNLSPGNGFRVEISLPIDLPSSEYVARFDFQWKGNWGEGMGIKPLEIMYSIDKTGRIWVR